MGCQHLLLCSVWPVWNGGGMLEKLAMSARLRSRIFSIPNSMFELRRHCIFAYLFTVIMKYDVMASRNFSIWWIILHLLVQGSVHTDLLAIPAIVKNRCSTFFITNAFAKRSV